MITVTFKDLPIGDVVLDTDLVEQFQDSTDAYYYITANAIDLKHIRYISATNEEGVEEMFELSRCLFDHAEIPIVSPE